MNCNLLTASEAAKALGVSRHFLYAHPEIPRCRLGPRTFRYDLEEVLEWAKVNLGEGAERPVVHRGKLYR